MGWSRVQRSNYQGCCLTFSASILDSDNFRVYGFRLWNTLGVWQDTLRRLQVRTEVAVVCGGVHGIDKCRARHPDVQQAPLALLLTSAVYPFGHPLQKFWTVRCLECQGTEAGDKTVFHYTPDQGQGLGPLVSTFRRLPSESLQKI